MAYIDRDKILKIINRYSNVASEPPMDDEDKIKLRLLHQLNFEFCALYPADVVEVKHGYWKDRYGNKYYNHLYECSVCGKKALYEFYYDELQQTKTRQVLSSGCPHCLAKMDIKKHNLKNYQNLRLRKEKRK